ncbi:hypothetical protein SAMN02745857_03628 [Andreprevotia lacus DSM 23236]|jgi:hypothetical protein|uniref:Uncharacterized protein n=1 Tax=Andreprevotia lacus DSM 23236 TaxID=1121001 RepID=A0A1W1XZ38_9NEIS|nr:hypothetical protein [Andreprevotia lacus]SMC29134.1 hypothetical protein SAMN02745857_03628 [Andreprevotia lacus DSM 23236]
MLWPVRLAHPLGDPAATCWQVDDHVVFPCCLYRDLPQRGPGYGLTLDGGPQSHLSLQWRDGRLEGLSALALGGPLRQHHAAPYSQVLPELADEPLLVLQPLDGPAPRVQARAVQQPIKFGVTSYQDAALIWFAPFTPHWQAPAGVGLQLLLDEQGALAGLLWRGDAAADLRRAAGLS